MVPLTKEEDKIISETKKYATYAKKSLATMIMMIKILKMFVITFITQVKIETLHILFVT